MMTYFIAVGVMMFINNIIANTKIERLKKRIEVLEEEAHFHHHLTNVGETMLFEERRNKNGKIIRKK